MVVVEESFFIHVRLSRFCLNFCHVFFLVHLYELVMRQLWEFLVVQKCLLYFLDYSCNLNNETGVLFYQLLLEISINRKKQNKESRKYIHPSTICSLGNTYCPTHCRKWHKTKQKLNQCFKSIFECIVPLSFCVEAKEKEEHDSLKY